MPVTYPEDTWINSQIEIRSSSVHGRGMFARTQLEAGEIVAIWGGVSGTEQEAEQAKLVMQLDDDLYTIEERGDDDTYFMNHSCARTSGWQTPGRSLPAETYRLARS